MHAGKHILAEIGTSTIVGILRNVCSSKVVQRLAQEMQDTRSTYVHKQAAMFLYEIVSIYPRDFVLSIANILKGFMKHCVQNQNGDCRSLGRKALLIWQQIDPSNSERIFHQIDSAMQRAILEDECNFALHKVCHDGSLQFQNHIQHDASV